MARRTLKITINPDLKSFLSEARRKTQSGGYRGESLSFEAPELFLTRLTALRWALVRALMGEGEIPLRELARRVGRDVKRVHGDITALTEMGLVERTDTGGVRCPYEDIHIDLHLRRAA